MITCDECGRKNDDEYKFCLGCGSPLSKSETEQTEDSGPEMVTCPFCGAEQPSNFKFCGSCGEEIPEEPEAGAGGTAGGAATGGGAADDSNPPPMPDKSGQSSPGQSSPASSRPGQNTPGQSAAAQSSPGQSSPAKPAGAAPSSGNRVTQPGGPAADSGTETVGRLVVIRPDGTEGAAIDIPADNLTLGRDSSVEALNDDPFLSPSHATIRPDDGQFVLRDDNSLNGIFREVRESVALSDGDQIRVGQELLEFEVHEQPAPDEDGTRRAGSPDPGYWGRLSVVSGPDIHSEAFGLEGDQVTIGRETGQIQFRDDGFVSGSHARVSRRDDGTVVLEDLDSSNGTFVRIRGSYTMEPGERVLMGQQLFRLEV